MFLDELASILVVAGVGIVDTNLFLGTGRPIPPPPAVGPFCTLVESGGAGFEGTHNSLLLPAYVKPNAQLFFEGQDYRSTRLMLDASYAAIFPIRNRLVLNVWWRSAIPLQECMDLGRSPGSGRVNLTFNISVTRRPNAAMSS